MATEQLTAEQRDALVEAARPLWDVLERLGWTDGHGGMEFQRVFPQALDFIYETANSAPVGESASGAITWSAPDRSPVEEW